MFRKEQGTQDHQGYSFPKIDHTLTAAFKDHKIPTPKFDHIQVGMVKEFKKSQKRRSKSQDDQSELEEQVNWIVKLFQKFKTLKPAPLAPVHHAAHNYKNQGKNRGLIIRNEGQKPQESNFGSSILTISDGNILGGFT